MVNLFGSSVIAAAAVCPIHPADAPAVAFIRKIE
jgi:hypothetical protein